MRRFQTTHTFTSFIAAVAFKQWLKANQNDVDYGWPLFVDLRSVGDGKTCVEYSCESQFPCGVAAGMEALALDSAFAVRHR